MDWLRASSLNSWQNSAVQMWKGSSLVLYLPLRTMGTFPWPRIWGQFRNLIFFLSACSQLSLKMHFGHGQPVMTSAKVPKRHCLWVLQFFAWVVVGRIFLQSWKLLPETLQQKPGCMPSVHKYGLRAEAHVSAFPRPVGVHQAQEEGSG